MGHRKLDDKLFEVIREHLPEYPSNFELLNVIRTLTLVTSEVTEEFINEIADRE